jgi:hypothetical protein
MGVAPSYLALHYRAALSLFVLAAIAFGSTPAEITAVKLVL